VWSFVRQNRAKECTVVTVDSGFAATVDAGFVSVQPYTGTITIHLGTAIEPTLTVLSVDHVYLNNGDVIPSLNQPETGDFNSPTGPIIELHSASGYSEAFQVGEPFTARPALLSPVRTSLAAAPMS